MRVQLGFNLDWLIRIVACAEFSYIEHASGVCVFGRKSLNTS